MLYFISKSLGKSTVECNQGDLHSFIKPVITLFSSRPTGRTTNGVVLLVLLHKNSVKFRFQTFGSNWTFSAGQAHSDMKSSRKYLSDDAIVWKAIMCYSVCVVTYSWQNVFHITSVTWVPNMINLKAFDVRWAADERQHRSKAGFPSLWPRVASHLLTPWAPCQGE